MKSMQIKNIFRWPTLLLASCLILNALLFLGCSAPESQREVLFESNETLEVDTEKNIERIRISFDAVNFTETDNVSFSTYAQKRFDDKLPSVLNKDGRFQIIIQQKQQDQLFSLNKKMEQSGMIRSEQIPELGRFIAAEKHLKITGKSFASMMNCRLVMRYEIIDRESASNDLIISTDTSGKSDLNMRKSLDDAVDKSLLELSFKLQQYRFKR